MIFRIVASRDEPDLKSAQVPVATARQSRYTTGWDAHVRTYGRARDQRIGLRTKSGTTTPTPARGRRASKHGYAKLDHADAKTTHPAEIGLPRPGPARDTSAPTTGPRPAASALDTGEPGLRHHGPDGRAAHQRASIEGPCSTTRH
jgi:hypothetical protein